MSMPSALEALSGPTGPLKREPPDPHEFAGLVHSGTARLADAERTENSFESRFDLAYNAAHALSLAALRHAGYRPSKRYIVFQALPHTLGLGPDVWRVLDKAHGARNLSEYAGEMPVDARLLDEVILACKKVLKEVRELPPL